MKTMKTLMLAGFSVLSLGVGAAMAQSQTPTGQDAYWAAQHRTAAAQKARTNGQVESGSSDVYTSRPATAPYDVNSGLEGMGNVGD